MILLQDSSKMINDNFVDDSPLFVKEVQDSALILS